MTHATRRRSSRRGPEAEVAPPGERPKPRRARGSLSATMEDYLEAIYRLSAGGGDCSVSSIATALEVKRPSVSKAIRRLKRQGLVVQAPYGRVRVTAEGRRVAQYQIRCHEAITRFLTQVLRLPPELAEHDACLMEHAISAQTAERLVEYVNQLEREGRGRKGRPFQNRAAGTPP